MTGKPAETCIAAVSGGPDSVYLVHRCREYGLPILLAHCNHQARGKASEGDRRFVERLSRSLGLPLEVGTAPLRRKGAPLKSKKDEERCPGFEKRARDLRYAFLREMKEKHGAKKILLGHTADDQVETILMRIVEGAGIAGVKGIPRTTEEGIERPFLDTWRGDILAYLEKHKVPYRIDRSNLDTRIERNWVRHVLLPLLEKRYGTSVKKRIFTLGERFRELDAYVENNAHNWLKRRGIKLSKKALSGQAPRVAVQFSRKAYAGLPAILRKKILQILCFEWIGSSPNERLLSSMDRMIVSGNSSARMSIGKGAALRCRYSEAILSLPREARTSVTGKGSKRMGEWGRHEDRWKGTIGETVKRGKKKGTAEPILKMDGQGIYRWKRPALPGMDIRAGSAVSISWEERGRIASFRIRKMAGGERLAAFDADRLPLPLVVRPLRAGDRVRPFGLGADKKVKEILIDRKVPREERWGRPVVCDASGKIVWIPGILRSDDAPVTTGTRSTIVLRADIGGEPPI